MIYGNIAKQYARSKYGYVSEAEIVSESDAILEALQHEYDNYNNIVMNESYFADDHERALNEARLEVIQEALSGAIIAAIIAGIAALIGIIVAVVLILKKGKKKIEEKAGDKPKEISDDEKKKIIDSIIGEQEDASNDDTKFKLSTYSDYDFTKCIKTGGVSSLLSAAESIKNSSGDVTDEKLNAIKDSLGDKSKINALLFEGITVGENDTFKQVLMNQYVKNEKSFYDVMNSMDSVKSTVDSLYRNAVNMSADMKSNLGKLEEAYKGIQGKITGTGDNAKKLTDSQQAVFKVTQEAIANMRKFIAAWQAIENQRMTLTTNIWARMMGTVSSTENKDEDKK